MLELDRVGIRRPQERGTDDERLGRHLDERSWSRDTCYLMVASMTVSPRHRLTVLYDGECRFCTRTARALQRLDSRHGLRLVPLQQARARVPDAPALETLDSSIHVVDERGAWWTGGEAFLRIADEIPVLRPLAVVGRLPVLRRAVEPGYRFVAAHRHQLGRLVDMVTGGPSSRSPST